MTKQLTCRLHAVCRRDLWRNNLYADSMRRVDATYDGTTYMQTPCGTCRRDLWRNNLPVHAESMWNELLHWTELDYGSIYATCVHHRLVFEVVCDSVKNTLVFISVSHIIFGKGPGPPNLDVSCDIFWNIFYIKIYFKKKIITYRGESSLNWNQIIINFD